MMKITIETPSQADAQSLANQLASSPFNEYSATTAATNTVEVLVKEPLNKNNLKHTHPSRRF